MGYYVRYKLEVIGADLDEVTTELEDIVGYDVLGGESDSQWYRDHEEHMLRLTKRFPAAVFTLHATGDDSGDVWRAYFKYGESPVRQQAKLVFPDPPPEWVTNPA